MDHDRLNEEYLALESWKSYEAFREAHREFEGIPFDLEMKMKFNELAQSGYEPTAFDNPLCHMELWKKNEY